MKNIIKTFKNLDSISKTLIVLMQTYFVWTVIWSIFINMYVYKYFWNINWIIIYNVIIYLLSYIWFFIVWYYISKYKLNMKIWYYISFIFIFITFFLIFISNNYYFFILYSIFYWLWLWSFWCSTHNYELAFIDNEKRDFYSSINMLWKNSLTIWLPLIISIIFILCWKQNLIWYKIIFFLISLLYLVNIKIIKFLPDYTPKSFKIKEIFWKINIKEFYKNLYFILTVQITTVPKIILIIISIFLLKTEVNIWVYQTIIWVISIIITWFLSTKRNEKNRAKYMAFFAVLCALNYILFWFNITIIWLIIFNLLNYIFSPWYEISDKVFSMKYMWNIKKDENWFLANVLYRENILLIWRLSFFIPFFIVINYYNFNILDIIQSSIFYIAFIYLLSIIVVYKLETKHNN